VGSAFGTLLVFMAAHTMLETARDALFLARIAASRLPWVYLAIAGGSLVVALFADRRARRTTSYGVSGWLLFSALSVIALELLIVGAGTWALYALYIWSGIISTVVLTRFWVLLGEHFTLTQAKRLYGLIGAGGVLGAIVGAAVASLITRVAHPRHLLTAAAGLLALAALGPLVLAQRTALDARSSAEPESLSPRLLFQSAYARRIGLLVLCSTLALTLADYVFKTSAAARVPAGELGQFFASVYLVLNVLSLVVQLALVQPIVRMVGVSGALTVLPVLLIGGAGGLLLSGGLMIALILKGADGALRYSLHRTVLELLFVPMSDRLRSSAKILIDVFGQRGGQALASLGILGAIALGARSDFLAAVLVAVAMLWIFIAYDLREHYVNLFRQTLRESAAHPRLRFPSLDLSSLETVIAALNSTNDAEVRAALHILAEGGRTRLIPALVLYHPSPEVVIDALEILDQSDRRDFLPITERLLEHGVPEVRAAVLRLRSARTVNEPLLRRLSEQDCAVTQATALVILIRAGLAGERERERLDSIARDGERAAKLALAQAIAHRPAAVFEDALIALAADGDVAVSKAALIGMAAAPTARYLPTLMRMLPQRELRNEARATLVAMGETALSFLAGALIDEDRPIAQRRHLPRTIMRFGGERAAQLLLEHLPVEQDGIVRYKILRALTQMRREEPELALNTEILDGSIDRTIGRTYQLIEWRYVLNRGAQASPERRTEAQSLLVRLLHDKEIHAIERIFLMLGLRYPDEDIATVFRAIRSSSANVRSSGRELLENLLEPPRREAILGLADEAPERERLELAGAYHRVSGADYETVLQALLETPSQAIKSLAVYHAAELGLRRLQPRIELLTEPRYGLLSGVARTAIEWLAELERRQLAVEG
jgi:AAA family ATP:ADP antiporter